MTTQESGLAERKVQAVAASLVAVLIVLVAQIIMLGLCGLGQAEANGTKVGLVPDVGGVDDMSFNWSAYQGLLRAEDELGVVGTVYTPTSSSECETKLQECIDEPNDLCIAVGFTMADATLTKAAANSGTDFAIVDFSWETYPSNLRGMVFASDEVGYLAGTLAGMMTVSDVIGAVGGMPIPPVDNFIDAYKHAAQCINPDVTVLISYTGTFVDPDLGAQAAQDMMAQNADVIFGVGGKTGEGAILTATQSGVWGIGVDMDQWISLFLSGTVSGSDKLLTSAMKRIDNAVFDTISDVVSDTFTSGTVSYDLAVDGVGLAPFHEADPYVSQRVRGALQRVTKGIIWGIIDPLTDTCPKYEFVPLAIKRYTP
jgi:basic membrane protein A